MTRIANSHSPPEIWWETDQEIFFGKIFRYLRSKMSSLVYRKQLIYIIQAQRLGPPEEHLCWKVLLNSGNLIQIFFLPHALLLKTAQYVYFRHSWTVFCFFINHLTALQSTLGHCLCFTTGSP